jgi:hypothetical protein
VDIIAFGHAGDGHLHVNVLTDTSAGDFVQRLAGLLDEVTTLVTELGGTPSGEHGDGRIRAPLLERIYGKGIMSLFGQVKRAFDPQGILNPGVILPAGSGSGVLKRLKVGAGAEEIPADVEQRLRELERTAAWDVPKTELVGAG